MREQYWQYSGPHNLNSTSSWQTVWVLSSSTLAQLHGGELEPTEGRLPRTGCLASERPGMAADSCSCGKVTVTEQIACSNKARFCCHAAATASSKPPWNPKWDSSTFTGARGPCWNISKVCITGTQTCSAISDPQTQQHSQCFPKETMLTQEKYLTRLEMQVMFLDSSLEESWPGHKWKRLYEGTFGSTDCLAEVL